MSVFGLHFALRYDHHMFLFQSACMYACVTSACGQASYLHQRVSHLQTLFIYVLSCILERSKFQSSISQSHSVSVNCLRQLHARVPHQWLRLLCIHIPRERLIAVSCMCKHRCHTVWCVVPSITDFCFMLDRVSSARAFILIPSCHVTRAYTTTPHPTL